MYIYTNAIIVISVIVHIQFTQEVFYFITIFDFDLLLFDYKLMQGIV